MTSADTDPLRERRRQQFSQNLNVAGAEFVVTSSDSRLLEIVDEAFGRLPAQSPASETPRLNVDMALAEGRSIVGAEVPPLQFRSGADLIVAAYDAINFAAISVPQRSAFVSVSSEMLAHRYELRYELVELAFLVLAQRAQSLVPLHAACLSLGGRGVLLSGVSGAGKSTLSLACMFRGFHFVAEDGVFVTPSDFHAIGCPNFLHLRSDMLRYVNDTSVAEAILASPVIRRRSGAEKFEVDVRRHPFAITTDPVPLAALILISADPMGDSEILTRISADEAVSALERDQPYARGLPDWARFRRGLASLPAFRLRRAPHPDQAADALRELLLTGQ